MADCEDAVVGAEIGRDVAGDVGGDCVEEGGRRVVGYCDLGDEGCAEGGGEGGEGDAWGRGSESLCMEVERGR